MALWDHVARFLSLEGFDHRELSAWYEFPDIDTQIAEVRRDQQATRPWRAASIRDALGVPAIQRAVTLIANTTGQLSVQGFRNGGLLKEPPRLIVRPDPDETPRDFYRDSAWNMATRGETVWWIANRDGEGTPTALVVVPLLELSIDANPQNRRRATYTWGNIKSTRWTPNNRTGQFVHVTYVKEPGELRGVGPLQLCGAAVSVSVESQEWAANFYADGGSGGTLIKSATELQGEEEANNLRAQFVAMPNNVPKVIDPGIEEVIDRDVNPQGAQMLDAREANKGDAANMFGMPGALLEYGRPGSSLTYQNIAEVFTLFVKTCLAPNYLEPIEQAMSDLLTRSTVARFNVKGFERADIKTRFEVYEKAVTVLGADEAAQWAREQEGFVPGDTEFAPVPFAPPAATPRALPRQLSGEVRCTGKRMLRGELTDCRRKLAEAGPFVGTCSRCGTVYPAAA